MLLKVRNQYDAIDPNWDTVVHKSYGNTLYKTAKTRKLLGSSVVVRTTHSVNGEISIMLTSNGAIHLKGEDQIEEFITAIREAIILVKPEVAQL